MNRNLVLFFLLLLWIISIPALDISAGGTATASDRTVVSTPYTQNFNGTFPPSGW